MNCLFAYLGLGDRSFRRRGLFLRSLALVTSSCLCACGGQPDSKTTDREISCAVRAPTQCPDPAPTYEQVAPIFEEKCNACHTPDDPTGPWPLESYAHITAWRSEVRDEVLNCTMPPEDGEPLTADTRLTLMQWILCGMPE